MTVPTSSPKLRPARALLSLSSLIALSAMGVFATSAACNAGTSGLSFSAGGSAGAGGTSTSAGGTSAGKGGSSSLGGSGGMSLGGNGGMSTGGNGGASGSAGTGAGGTAGTSNGGSGGTGGTSSCDPTMIPMQQGAIFVSPSAPDGGNGTASKPYKSITDALNGQSGNDIGLILDEATYNEAVVVNDDGYKVGLYGGFNFSGGTWMRDCSATPNKTLIISPKNIGIDVQAATEFELREVTVKTKDSGTVSMATAGESLYGVFIHPMSIKSLLDTVSITAGDAADGGAAQTPAPVTGTSQCNGTSDCNDGLAGTTPPAGANGTAGSWDNRNGYSPGNGQSGMMGASGDNGPVSQIVRCVTGCGIGSGGLCSPQGTILVYGTCGCGGLGGNAGGEGFGGGASVAVVANGMLTLINSTLIAGKGGNGSQGSMGGSGTPGTAGAQNSMAPTCSTFCKAGVASCNLGTPMDTLSGGMGGPGSSGSSGGGGSGGPSYALFTFSGGMLTQMGNTLRPGTPGMGGGSAPGGMSGPTGM